MSDLLAGGVQSDQDELLPFLYACPVGLAEFDGDGLIRLINPFAMKLLQPLAPTSMAINFFTFMDPYAPELRNMIDDFLPPHGAICDNHRIFVKPGSDAAASEPTVLSCTLVKLSPMRFMLTLADISSLVAQERRLNEAEAWFASLLDDVNEFAVVSLDAAGRIDAVNPSVLLQTGFLEHEVLGRTLDMFRSVDAGSLALDAAAQIAMAHRNGWHLEEGWYTRRNGERYWCQTLIAAQAEGNGHDGELITSYAVVLRHVRWQASNAANLRQMLTKDHLTGACNRAHFFGVAERACSLVNRHGTLLSLIMVDVDHFKLVNDTYGHGGGDQALKALSQACMSMLRPSDTFARIGGEEFAILLPATDLAGAAELAERLRGLIAKTPIMVDGKVIHCTASFGCADMNGQPIPLTALLASADAALYKAKKTGRNRVVLAGSVLSSA